MPILQPVYADIGILESCNLKCQMCKMYEINPLAAEELIPLERWEMFFEDLKKIAPPGFIFNLPGGEPLTHPHIFQIIKIASLKGLRPLLSTNGYLLTKDVAKKLIESGLFAATISVDSMIPQLHDNIRGVKNTFERLNAGMRYMDFYSKVYRGEKFNTGIQGVIQKSNLKTIPDLVIWAEKNPLIDRINLNLLMQPNNTTPSEDWYKEGFSHLWPDDPDKVDEVIDKLISLKKTGKAQKLLNKIEQLESYKIYFNDPKKTPKLVKCDYDKSICTNSSGDIHLCYYYPKIGNIKSGRLLEAWESDEASEIRDKIGKCKITSCWFRLNCLYSK